MRLLLICAALPLCACHASWDHGGQAAQPSGTGAARTFAASGFTRGGAAELGHCPGADRRRLLGARRGHAEVLDRLDIRVDGDRLKIGRTGSSGWNWGNDTSARIYVTLPRLVSADVDGSGDLDADHATGDFAGRGVGVGQSQGGRCPGRQRHAVGGGVGRPRGRGPRREADRGYHRIGHARRQGPDRRLGERLGDRIGRHPRDGQRRRGGVDRGARATSIWAAARIARSTRPDREPRTAAERRGCAAGGGSAKRGHAPPCPAPVPGARRRRAPARSATICSPTSTVSRRRAYDVHVVTGGATGAHATGDARALERLTLRNDGGTLVVTVGNANWDGWRGAAGGDGAGRPLGARAACGADQRRRAAEHRSDGGAARRPRRQRRGACSRSMRSMPTN